MSSEHRWRRPPALLPLLPLLLAAPAPAQEPVIKGFDGVLTGEVGPAKAPAAPAAPTPPPIRPLPAWGGNYRDANRTAKHIDMIVIHKCEGRGAARWFADERSEVSAHYDVSFDGTVLQSVDDEDIAWHAGDSDVNRRSIGIEHDGWVAKNDTTTAQYEASARLVAWLSARYGIPLDREHIIAHSEVGGTGGANGHSDPGKHWDWDRYMALVRKYASGGSAPGSAGEATLAAGHPAREGDGAASSAGGIATHSPASGVATHAPSDGVASHAAGAMSHADLAANGADDVLDGANPGGTVPSGPLGLEPPPPPVQAPPPPPPPSGPPPQVVRVKSPGLNVRCGPGSDYSVVARINEGESYPVLERRGPWTRIQVGSRQGWSYGAFLQPAPAPVRQVTATRLVVRAGPGPSYPALGALRQGARVAILGTSGGWQQVWFQGRRAWVSGSYLAE